MWRDSFVCVKGLIHMCDITHSYVWRDSFIRRTWLIHMCDMTHSYVWHDSFICVTCIIHMCDMTHSYVWHDSFAPVPGLFFEDENRTIFPKGIFAKEISSKRISKLALVASNADFATCTLEWIHKSPTSIFSQPMFLSNICTALFEKEKRTMQSKAPVESRDFPSFLWAHTNSPHIVRLLELLLQTREVSFVLESRGFPSFSRKKQSCDRRHMCDLTHLYLWHDSLICVAWLFIFVTWLT